MAHQILTAMQAFADAFHTLGIGPVTRQVLHVQMHQGKPGSALQQAAQAVRQALKESPDTRLHYFDYKDGQPVYVGPIHGRERTQIGYTTITE